MIYLPGGTEREDAWLKDESIFLVTKTLPVCFPKANSILIYLIAERRKRRRRSSVSASLMKMKWMKM